MALAADQRNPSSSTNTATIGRLAASANIHTLMRSTVIELLALIHAHRVADYDAHMHYLLFYDVVPDYVERRAPLRSAHLEQARESHARGDLVLAGALADPPDGAVFVFRTQDAAEAFARTDPYVLNGLVTSWRVRRWTTVIGDGARPPAL